VLKVENESQRKQEIKQGYVAIAKAKVIRKVR
jgi:hypothetical protein